MSIAPAPAGRPITLNQLIALNQEIAALARAGVPLDQGLLHLGRDMPGRMGRFAQQIGDRLAAGQSLGDALRSIPDIPPVYAAIIAAGLRSGRLAVALEDMSALIRRVAEMRRLVSVSLIYPLFVLFIAIQLCAFTLQKCFPVMHRFYKSVMPDSRSLIVLEWLAAALPYWVPAAILLMILGVVVWSIRARRVWSAVQGGAASPRQRKRATPRNVIYAGRMAAFAETLATLIQHQVALPEALRLASDACGDRRVRDSGRRLAQRLEAGEVIEPGDPLPGAPRLLGLVVLGGGSPERLASALRRISQTYRQEAMWMSRWMAAVVPLSLTVVIGGTATMAYALSVLWPFVNVLIELSKASVR